MSVEKKDKSLLKFSLDPSVAFLVFLILNHFYPTPWLRYTADGIAWMVIAAFIIVLFFFGSAVEAAKRAGIKWISWKTVVDTLISLAVIMGAIHEGWELVAATEASGIALAVIFRTYVACTG